MEVETKPVREALERTPNGCCNCTVMTRAHAAADRNSRKSDRVPRVGRTPPRPSSSLEKSNKWRAGWWIQQHWAKTDGALDQFPAMAAFRALFPTSWKTCLPYTAASATRLVSAVKSGIFKCAALAACIALGASSAFAWRDNATMRIIETQTMFVRHTANEYQRRVAEQNAKAFFKKLPPAKKAELKKKKVKAVLIPTPRSPQTPPEVKDVRLPYSLEGSLIESYTLEFNDPLIAGTITKPKGYQSVYVSY